MPSRHGEECEYAAIYERLWYLPESTMYVHMFGFKLSIALLKRWML